MTWFPILERVNVLARVAQILRPGVVNQCPPVIDFSLGDRFKCDLYQARSQVGRQLDLEMVLLVNATNQPNGIHNSIPLPICGVEVKS
jgi:hypothetical protein